MSKVTYRDVLVKQPSESRKYTFEFKSQFNYEQGEVLSGTPTLTSTPDGLTISEIGISDDLLCVQARIAGGENKQRYRLECVCNTTFGQRMAMDGLIDVKDE